MGSFEQSFLLGIGEAYSVDDAALEALAPGLEALLARARERWPGVHITGHDFAEHLARSAPESDAPLAALDAMHTDDMYLALACSRGDATAVALFEAEVLTQASKAIARVDGSAPFIADAVSEVRRRLLVADGRPARIRGYVGRGPLTSWVMVTAVRTAYDLKRRRKQEVPSGTPGLDLIFDGDAELRVLRDEVRAPFGDAFRAALAALEPRERNLLRLYLIEDVSAEAIGAMYGVHRATVARWIVSARTSVEKGTRKRLRDALQIGDSTFESLMRELSSRLDVPLVSSLGSAFSPDAADR